jgi:hypothetical protein
VLLGQSRSESAGGFCYAARAFVLAGPIVAYLDLSISGSEEGTTTTEESRSFWLVVRDLRNGHIVHQVTTTAHVTTAHPVERGRGFFARNRPSGTFVVKRDGAVAWIAAAATSGVPRYDVRALDGAGNRLLAAGPEIDPHSLALAGGTLYWTQGGKPYSATLN